MNRIASSIPLLACIAAVAFGQLSARPDKKEVSFHAASQTIDGSVLHLKGAAQVGNFIHADEIDLDLAKNEIEAHGNVRIGDTGPGSPKRAFRGLRGNLVTGKWQILPQ